MSRDVPLDASAYGDDDGPPVDVGPPCDSCGEREAVESRTLPDGRTVDLCGPCIVEDRRDDVEDGGRS